MLERGTRFELSPITDSSISDTLVPPCLYAFCEGDVPSKSKTRPRGRVRRGIRVDYAALCRVSALLDPSSKLVRLRTAARPIPMLWNSLDSLSLEKPSTFGKEATRAETPGSILPWVSKLIFFQTPPGQSVRKIRLPIRFPEMKEARAARLFFLQSKDPEMMNAPAVAQSMAACTPGLITFGRGLVASSASLVDIGMVSLLYRRDAQREGQVGSLPTRRAEETEPRH